ncbi:hypothetical protein HNY73_020298 [Argiope bruennichi]|uniref:Uncharacterized protein n=1 Tax=Argiope bruennichi TaxID=94029 RepID=A0A8T0E7G5_ARGBR|nr:hypothetical protein HNY73_020298 [Argiope bruennichi]
MYRPLNVVRQESAGGESLATPSLTLRRFLLFFPWEARIFRNTSTAFHKLPSFGNSRNLSFLDEYIYEHLQIKLSNFATLVQSVTLQRLTARLAGCRAAGGSTARLTLYPRDRTPSCLVKRIKTNEQDSRSLLAQARQIRALVLATASVSFSNLISHAYEKFCLFEDWIERYMRMDIESIHSDAFLSHLLKNDKQQSSDKLSTAISKHRVFASHVVRSEIFQQITSSVLYGTVCSYR